jgi:hypothetical protein
MFRFSSFGEGNRFLSERGYNVQPETSNVYYVYPIEVPLGYPTIGRGKPVHVGILLADGIFSICNTRYDALGRYHASLENELAQKKIL